MRAVAAVLMLVVLASPANTAAQTAITPEHVMHLFDGKSLDGFYAWLLDSRREDPWRVFTVVDRTRRRAQQRVPILQQGLRELREVDLRVVDLGGLQQFFPRHFPAREGGHPAEHRRQG
jgi:hypothetical protein